MKINWYSLKEDHFRRIQTPLGWLDGKVNPTEVLWAEVAEVNVEELKNFLGPLNIHPLQLERCLDADIDPGVITVGGTVLMEYPASLNRDSSEQAFITILLQNNILVTVRNGFMPALDSMVQEFTANDGEPLHHLPQVIYEILDHFADLNVESQMQIRDQILALFRMMKDNPVKVDGQAISDLRWQVGNLISLIENQLYCVSRLAAADLAVLKDEHSKAYIDDIVSEAEIARQAVYRLENRVKDIYDDYQMLGSDRVERRLRLLTVVSAITLPLGLIAGLLGMNVGGVPWTTFPAGFITVILIMVIIGLVQFIYFKKHGWFD